MNKRKELTTSTYNFKGIINSNCMYVDKTKEIYKLVKRHNGQFFMSRPRRFGKSLTLSTLESFFKGEKELFKGLYIYDKDDLVWENYPIIKLSMNAMSSNTLEEFEENLAIELKRIARRFKIKLETKRASQRFKELIENLEFEKNKNVVILIDEYDKPILDNILDKAEVLKIRTFLKNFYGIIKAMEEYLRFTFLTGVSKFTQVSVFSDLNNLDDISMDEDFATICGFTQNECEKYFDEWIVENAEKNKMSKKDYLQKIKVLYNGMRFSRKEITVYNPVSFTKAMDKGNFIHYWFETGTPSMLLKLLKKNDYNIANFEGLKLDSATFSSYEVDNIKIEALLYQTGYLTIVDYDEETDVYTLSYPNNEVKTAFIRNLAEYFTPVSPAEYPTLLDHLVNALKHNDLEKIFNKILKVFYSEINYDIKLKHERYYQSIFYVLFMMLGTRIETEVHTNDGRMDCVIKTDSHIYIFEFKLDKTTKEAIEQIKQKEYYNKYLLDERELVLIGVNFNSNNGTIKEWEVENIKS